MQNISNANENSIKIFLNARNNNSMLPFTIAEEESMDVASHYYYHY